MEVDVILTTYNSSAHIRDTLDSIMSQTYSEFTLYINDDSSTDNTVSIIEEYVGTWPNKISLHVNPKNVGPARNSQHLLERTRGDIIFLCGHDDLFYQDKLEKCVSKFSSDSEISLLYHDCMVSNSEGPMFPYSKTHKPRSSSASQYLIYGCFSTACSVSLRGQLARKVGIRDIGPSSDSLLFYEVAKLGKIHYIDEVLGTYFRHESNCTKRNENRVDFSGVKASTFVLEMYPEDRIYALINLNWVILRMLSKNKVNMLLYIFTPILTLFWLSWIKFGKSRID